MSTYDVIAYRTEERGSKVVLAEDVSYSVAVIIEEDNESEGFDSLYIVDRETAVIIRRP